MSQFETWKSIGATDAEVLLEAEKHYGDSWKKRGGTGAFMMLARKWDRLELQVAAHKYDIFEAISQDNRAEGIIDDLRDLRRYLTLVEAHMAALGHTPGQVCKGATTYALPPGTGPQVAVKPDKALGKYRPDCLTEYVAAEYAKFLEKYTTEQQKDTAFGFTPELDK
jgi:hypothetical protein